MIRFKNIFFFFIILCSTESLKSVELNELIPPEIKNDAFYNAIVHLTSTEKLSNILEIGSSSGDGSTEAFVLGIRQNPNKPNLFCMEISKDRCEALRNRYLNEPFIHCYQVSSVPSEAFPSEAEVISFYNSKFTKLNAYPLDWVLSWLKRDKNYVETQAVPQNGIKLIKEENGIDTFDMVLIDGCEFIGKAEMELVYGAKYILLDDTYTFKNYANHLRLSQDSNYELMEENPHLRNGYSIFKRKT